MSTIEIVEYEPGHQRYFEAFNRAWIEELFDMEPVDEWVLANPDKAILEPGGAILMAYVDNTPAATVGLRKVDDETFEFTKMAVDKNFKRRGVGEAISKASFRKAATLGAKTLILYTNTANTGAVPLYEKLGFRHTNVEPGIYKRANVKMYIDIESALAYANR